MEAMAATRWALEAHLAAAAMMDQTVWMAPVPVLARLASTESAWTVWVRPARVAPVPVPACLASTESAWTVSTAQEWMGQESLVRPSHSPAPARLASTESASTELAWRAQVLEMEHLDYLAP